MWKTRYWTILFLFDPKRIRIYETIKNAVGYLAVFFIDYKIWKFNCSYEYCRVFFCCFLFTGWPGKIEITTLRFSMEFTAHIKCRLFRIIFFSSLFFVENLKKKENGKWTIFFQIFKKKNLISKNTFFLNLTEKLFNGKFQIF